MKPLLKISFILVFFSITIGPVHAQYIVNNSDSISVLADLSYNSPLEEKFFKAMLEKKDKESILGLFMAIDSTVTNASYAKYLRFFQDALHELKTKKLEKKTPEKKIKTIYGTVHDMFLKKYELENNFSDIFSIGSYNCVSATALYSLIFHELRIPYKIKETPTHVYIISYPNTSSILVETTDPTAGYYMLNERFKENFVNNLKSNKLISDAEYRTASINEIFDQYYFSESDISLIQLLGIQYSNDAIYKMDKLEWEKAFFQLEKGYLLYPSEKIKFLLLSASANILENIKYGSTKDLDLLVKISRHQEVGITPENIAAEFHKITRDQLIDDYQPTRYGQSYQYLMAEITDSATREEISVVYNYELGRVLLNKGEFRKSLEALENAYRQRPTNVDVQSMLIGAIINDLRSYDTNTEVVARMESHSKSFPQLIDNNNFASVLAGAYLIQFGQAFEQNKRTEGEKYKILFEEMYQKRSHLSIDKSNIGRAYSIAAIFFFKNGNTAKAKKILHEGLALSPGNFEITQRLNMMR